ncbi:MAG: hypothetical protein ACYC1X_09165 [Coriobacteriia bacterium]
MLRIRSKALSIVVAVLLLGSMLGVAAPAAAVEGCDVCANCGAWEELPLYADQDELVGKVLVNNCEEHICVKYVLDAGSPWRITEVHLAIGDSVAEIPQTKKGNPIPGQFEVSEYLGPYGVTESEVYCFPMGDRVAGDEIVVAAHAVVTKRTPGVWSSVWQIGDVEERDATTGLLYNYADEFNWEYPASPTTMGPTLAVSKPAFANPFIVGSSETTEFPWNSNYNANYARSVDVQWDGALPWGGRLLVSWSPGNSAFETKVIDVSGDGLDPIAFTSTGTVATGEGWFMNQYKLVENEIGVDPLAYGTHTINFLQTSGDGTFWDWIRLEQPGLDSQSAWAGTMPFAGANWATYGTYTIKGWELVDTVQVLPNGATYASNTALDEGSCYLLEAVGTYRFGNWGDAGIADAKYSLRPPNVSYSYHTESVNTWVSGNDIPAPYTNYLEVWVDGAPAPWGALNEAHVYTVPWAGDGTSVEFKILDTAYGDNSGFITINIYEFK